MTKASQAITDFARQLPGACCYKVGGAVRDELLGLPIKDVDWVVVGADAQAMHRAGYHAVGKDFPVFLHPTTGEEYALARTERKTAAGYHGFDFDASPDVTLQQDLLRRDLTINAMARDGSGAIIDPFDGQGDLKRRILRHVSPAFAEDPVRILRVARFSARLGPLGFTLADTTRELMRRMVKNGEVDALVPERIWQEFSRALAEPSPQIFIQVLRDCGALAHVLPEIDALFGIPNPEKWHPEIDSGIHSLMALEQCSLLSRDPRVRFAALCHDLGKGVTPKALWPSHKGHEKAGVAIVRALCMRLRAPKNWRALAELSAEFHLHTHRILEMKAPTIVTTLERLDAFRRASRFHEFLLVCAADFRGRTGFEHKPYTFSQHFADCFDAANNVNTADIAKTCAVPAKIAQQIHRSRVHAVENIIARFRPNAENKPGESE